MTIFDAFRSGQTTEFTRLLEEIDDINRVDEHGWTLLHWAAGKGNLELVTRLVERGADVWRLGRDNRTPYLVALAAGHLETVEYLTGAEERHGGDREKSSSRQQEDRQYCKAFPIEMLRTFSGWGNVPREIIEGAGADILFLHQDLTLTRSVLHGENLLPGVTSTPEWRSFCLDQLEFKPPTDIDLLSAR
jgi:hypothetical protein